MAEKRGQWKKEQELYATQTKEALEEKKKSQAREDEEYLYKPENYPEERGRPVRRKETQNSKKN